MTSFKTPTGRHPSPQLPGNTHTPPSTQIPSENSNTAPKRGKFFRMEVAQQQQQQQQHKRDKFASMAAARQSQTTTTAAPKRDKFASMTAAAAATSGESLTVTPSEKDIENAIKKRMKQRDQVFKDLEQAEGWTWQLLTLACQTARSLSDLTADNNTDISEMSAKYRETLQKIHSILTPHAHLVVPYQNHQVDKKEEVQQQHTNAEEDRINMYAARVEMRLAQERRNVLNELLRLEKESEDSLSEPSEADTGLKRKRDD